VSVDVDLKTAQSITLQFKDEANNSRPLEMSFSDSKFAMPGTEAPLFFSAGKRKLNLRIFFDRSVLEVFANGTVCATKVIPPLAANTSLSIQARSGEANASLVQVWPIKTIW
jgi:sucrose-6-phosphate hydrolase SacC (GH32 family)